LGSVDEAKVLQDLAEIVVKPSYRLLAETATTLKDSIVALVDEPTALGLATTQAAWRDTQAAWSAARVFGFGPAKDVEANIRWNKGCEPEAVEETIASGPPFEPSSFGTTRKGLPALEYLLFDSQAGDEVVLMSLAEDDKRRAFLRALGDDLASEVNRLVAAFAKHAEELATAGAGSEVYKSPKDAMDALFNQLLYASDLAIQTIAAPLGSNTGVLAPELEESRRSDNTLQDTLALLAGAIAVYYGDYADVQGLGMGDLVKDRSPTLDSEFQAALTAAEKSVKNIPGPLRTALESEAELLAKAVEALRSVKQLLASDLATALGVTISFSDMDGD
jgi:predicted lipoprotein